MAMPLLRFKQDDGINYPEWKEDVLSSFFNKITTKNKEEKISNVITNSAKYGLIPQTAFFDKEIANADNTDNYFVINHGDFVYNPRSSKEAPCGPIKVYEMSDTGIVSPLYKAFTPIREIVTKYWKYYFETTYWNPYLIEIGGKGARHDRFSIKDKDLFALPINIPSSVEEQQKIADFFSAVDNQIEHYQQSLDNLESQKKELLRQVFSQELRFTKDDGSNYPDWMNDKFKNVFVSLSYGMSAAAKPFDGKNKYIRITDIDDFSHKYKSQDIVSPNAELKDKYLVKNRDILFARTGATVGKTYIYNMNDGTVYYAGYLIRGNVKTEYVPMFIFYVTLTGEYWKWVNHISKGKTAQPGINSKQYESYEFLCPCFEEQQKIADFFSDFDERIELERQRLQTMQELKKGLLQQMFC